VSLLTYLRYRFARPHHRLTEQEQWIASPAFLQSYEWKVVRYQALKRNNGRCELCGRGKHDGAVLNVDHILPRRLFPQLALNLYNLQVLDSDCNTGKSNWDHTDWRKPKRLPLRLWFSIRCKRLFFPSRRNTRYR
jgi:5-methylcytosine-specific restriction endonuclease McrA